MPLIVAVGFGAGAAIAVITVLIEHYGPSFGKYALFGNGALIVPALLAPFAIFLGWTWARRRGGRALELAMFIIGLHFGVGVISVLDAVLYPSSADITIADAFPGFLFSGALFVLPASLLAGLALWATSRFGGVALGVACAIVIVFAAELGGIFGAGLGLLAGAAVRLASLWPGRTAVIAVALLVLIVVLGNLTYLTLLFTLPAS